MKCNCGDETEVRAIHRRTGKVSYFCDSCRYVEDAYDYEDMGLIEILKEYDEEMDVVAGYYVSFPMR